MSYGWIQSSVTVARIFVTGHHRVTSQHRCYFDDEVRPNPRSPFMHSGELT